MGRRSPLDNREPGSGQGEGYLIFPTRYWSIQDGTVLVCGRNACALNMG